MYRSRFVVLFALLLLLTVVIIPGVSAQQSGTGYFYYANGQVVTLQASSDFIAVRTTPGTRAVNAAGLRGLTGVGNISNAIETDLPGVMLIPLAPGSNGIATANAVQLTAASGIQWAMPVFQVSDIYHVVTDRFLASFPTTMTEAQIDAYNAQYGVQRVEKLTNNLDNLYVLQVTRASGRNALDMANFYQTSGAALYATPEFLRLEQSPRFQFVPNDPIISYHLNNTGQFGGTPDADIDAFEAWDLQQGSPSIKIAILDSGVEITHPDLAAQIVNPLDAVNDDTDPSPETPMERSLYGDAHGTMVAGLAAARTNNSVGVSGVCPNCTIMPIRIAHTLNNGFTQFLDSNIIQGFDHARVNGAAIMNNSWGGGFPSTGITNAINNAVNYGRYNAGTQTYLGAVVVFAAGNDYNEPVIYPANLPNVMAVGATNQCDQHKAPFENVCNGYEDYWGSNAGPEMDIAAPGVWLDSTDLLGADGSDPTDYTGYMNGTSGASPIVSGVAGLILSENPNLTGGEVQTILTASANDVTVGSNMGPGFDYASGWGRVNAFRAVQLTEYLLIAPPPPASPTIPERPVLTWNDFLPANYFFVEVRNASTNAVVTTQWFNLGGNCNGTTCSGQLNVALPLGSYKYRVAPTISETNRSAGSFTPFSASFTIAAPALVGPTGTVTPVGGNPLYSWTGLTGATHYYLMVVNAANQTVINEVVDAVGYCTGLNCNLDPTTIRESARLTNGTYRYYVRAWLQAGGTGAWSTMGTFTLNAAPPAAPTLNIPSGLSTLRPTFDWNAPTGATWLHLYVVPAAGGAAVVDQWLTRTQACGSPTGTVCQPVSPVNLLDGAAYNYQVQAYGPGGIGAWSPPQPFAVNVPSPALPTGMNMIQQANGFVRVEWNDDPNTSWFNVLIKTTTNVVIHNQWYQKTGALCNAGLCSVVLSNNFTSGSTYRMWMTAYGDGGITAAVQNPTDLVVSLAAPVAVTSFVSPLSTITTDRPLYRWNEVANASYYYLVTSTGQGTAWYSAQSICTGGVCTVTPTASIANGSFTWYVTTYGPGGMGTMSAIQNFSLGFTGVPAAPLVNNPGTVNTPNPVLTWTRDSNVTQYHVYLTSAAATIKNNWYHVSQICDLSTCTLALNDVTLANGSYNLYIQGSNPAGLGAWSSLVAFTVNVPAPDAPTLVTPINGGIVLTNRPTFTWNTVPNATWYNLELINSQQVVAFTQWISAPTICTPTCNFTPTTVIPFGIYNWHVRGYSQGGIGSFSSMNLLYALSASIAPQMVEANDGVMRNPGNWSAIQDASALGGSYASNAAGTSGSMMLTFNGTGIDVVYIGGPGYGSFIVELDGYNNQVINSSYAETHYGLAIQIQGLTAGEHTLRIVPVNGASVAIDAFYIAGSFVIGGERERPTEVPTQVPTETPTEVPTEAPTEVPTEVPTEAPTEAPTETATEVPTEAPTEVPTETPTP